MILADVFFLTKTLKDRAIFVDDRVGQEMPQAKTGFKKIPEYVGVILETRVENFRAGSPGPLPSPGYGKAGSSGRTCFYNLDNKHSYSKANVIDENLKRMGNLFYFLYVYENLHTRHFKRRHLVFSSIYMILTVKFHSQKDFIFLCERSSLDNETEYSLN